MRYQTIWSSFTSLWSTQFIVNQCRKNSRKNFRVTAILPSCLSKFKMSKKRYFILQKMLVNFNHVFRVSKYFTFKKIQLQSFQFYRSGALSLSFSPFSNLVFLVWAAKWSTVCGISDDMTFHWKGHNGVDVKEDN